MKSALKAGLSALVVGVIVVVGAAVYFMQDDRSSMPTVTQTGQSGKALIGGPFELVDGSGRTVTDKDFRGKCLLVFFGFTHCPDVCPITLQILAGTAGRLAAHASDGPGDAPADAASTPEVVFVSVDPHRDTPAAIRRYLDGFDPSFTGATGSDAALAPLLKALGVTVQKHDHQGERYNVVHNGTVYFIGPRGEWIALSSPPHDPAVLAADFLAVRASYLRTFGADALETTASDGEEARTAAAR